MPTYVYRTLRPGQPEETFEVHQSMRDPALTHHPETGDPVERVLTVPMVGGSKLGDAAIRNSGLTKYTKTVDGSYEKSD